MLSENIFPAASRIPNRYKLCQALAKATRRLHLPSTRTQDTTNQILIDIGRGTYGTIVAAQAMLPPPPELEVATV
jgi:hypothetical protein